MHRPFLVLVLLLVVLVAAVVDDLPMLGFSKEGAAQQRALEARYDGLLAKENLDRWMQRMVAQPQHVGSPYALENAEFMVSLFRSWGYEAEIEEFQVLFPTPTVRVVELVEPRSFSAQLREPTLAEDATSTILENRLPGYNAYSADGDVTAELVYVNQGIPRDYEELERLGIDVEGKIVLARYGGSWRGIKPKVAAEHGAVGCILYSDPRDDGYFRGDVYPKGPFRMEYGVQRGSVLDMPLYPGDPLTPGVGATAEAERLSRDEAPTLMKIPVLPISYADALPLLQALEGPVAPPSWRGALPLTYHVGPGPAKVHLKLAFDWQLTPAYNVVARVRGAEYPDEWIVRGNHRDGWVFGAADPISGMVALMEEARALGALMKTGWRPKRTIVYAGWDAEEPGLLGSTEWAEAHADELREKAVVYINTDGNGRGFLRMGGSHTLEKFINEVARDVEDPQTGVSVFERARALRRVNGDREAGTR
ncbi:MAG: M28 family peptidase, partial [Rhodothermales bacterium]